MPIWIEVDLVDLARKQRRRAIGLTDDGRLAKHHGAILDHLDLRRGNVDRHLAAIVDQSSLQSGNIRSEAPRPVCRRTVERLERGGARHPVHGQAMPRLKSANGGVDEAVDDGARAILRRQVACHSEALAQPGNVVALRAKGEPLRERIGGPSAFGRPAGVGFGGNPRRVQCRRRKQRRFHVLQAVQAGACRVEGPLPVASGRGGEGRGCQPADQKRASVQHHVRFPLASRTAWARPVGSRTPPQIFEPMAKDGVPARPNALAMRSLRDKVSATASGE